MKNLSDDELFNRIKQLDNDVINYVYYNKRYVLYKFNNCPYCNRLCPNSNSLMSHLRYHKEFCDVVGIRTRKGFENVDRSVIPVWNKGLTKDTDERVKISSELIKETLLRKYGYGSSWNYWYRTEWNNDPINYPQYYLSDEDIETHNNEIYKKFKNNFISMLCSESGSSRGWHSYPEELLGDILFKLNIYYIREYNIYDNSSNYLKYRIDYYLPDFNTGLECDGMFKYDQVGKLKEGYVNRKQHIESLTGIRIINIPSNSIFYYNKNKRELLNLINKLEYPLIRL